MLPLHTHAWCWGEQRWLRAQLAALGKHKAGGCSGSPPGTPLFLVGSHTSTHHWLQDVTAQRGRGNHTVAWHKGSGDGCWEGLSAVPPLACWHRDLPGGLCTLVGLGEEVREGGETLTLLHLSVCCTHQMSMTIENTWWWAGKGSRGCGQTNPGESRSFPKSSWRSDAGKMWGTPQVSGKAAWHLVLLLFPMPWPQLPASQAGEKQT